MLAGWGGVWALAPGMLSDVSGPSRNISRLLVFKLGGNGQSAAAAAARPDAARSAAGTALAAGDRRGGAHFGRYCGVCHGDAAVAGSLIPDLRHSGAINSAESFKTIVYDGALKDNGMVSFKPVMTPEEVEAIRHYVIHRANEDKALEAASKDRK